MAGYWFPHKKEEEESLIKKAVKSSNAVGAYGASNKPQYAVSPSLQPKGYDLKIEMPNSAQETLVASKDATSLINNNESKTISGSLTQQEHSNPSESYKGKVWSEMSGAEKFQGGAAAALKILDTLDMLTGGKDKILPGSGHTYSPKQDTSMYIGQGMGY
tara:strand:- start:45 stop:524 length:480 start_codon:yes stop_codon:yes gene_type:complete